MELDAGKGRKTVASLLAADRETRTLVEAEGAFWVMGGRKPGVMTRLPKWAFQSEAGANAFLRAHGGKVVSWAEALAAAREELDGKRR